MILTFKFCLDSSEAHSEENKASQDNKKRRLKTPSQVMALEKFYNGKSASLLNGIIITLSYCVINA